MSLQKRQLSKEVVKKIDLKYLLSLPAEYNEKKTDKWPLILFLHGAGERGENLDQVKVNGIPKVIEEKTFDLPFITVSPQCPRDSYWPLQVDSLNELLNTICEEYSVDEDRIYVTGLSMGGYGTWQLAVSYPNRFAAIAPVCGGGIPHLMPFIRHVPVWAFHGAKDDIVPLYKSDEMVDALKACKGNVRYTVYPEANHDSWTETYNNEELYTWLLQHKRIKS
ncbi:prolyl oligopeptidase family serine peptidase [Bacillus horti]|uniref:Peptidase n=1 Tax=Caldalkalibacillus horti TaxID=77523 RepID=A0ABT9W581_9BACI|nr:prolyl oligopeptidase family serine peptidase [Bacillus horti]MDQ0168400.1 putative peptidase [Bacillus horti]